MIEHRSPHVLLQEILWPNRWQSTVACLLLNRTKRAQVDKIWPRLFSLAPTPEALLLVKEELLCELLKPLGLSKVRCSRLRKLAKGWVDGIDYEKLHGVGEYALASDKIFYRGEIPENVDDHALVAYLKWLKTEDGKVSRDSLRRASDDASSIGYRGVQNGEGEERSNGDLSRSCNLLLRTNEDSILVSASNERESV